MWPRSSGARPLSGTFIRKEPGAMAWWCLDGLSQGLAEPWRELWRLRSQPMDSILSMRRTTRDYRSLRKTGSMDGWRQNLEPSNNVEMLQPPAHQDVSERRLDNLRPQVAMWERDASGDGQEPGRRERAWSIEGSQALTQQAELISRQLQELRQFEEEVRLLRETSLQQKIRLESQAMELEALARAEKAGRTEAEGLRAALAGAEVIRKNLEEGSQRELEEVQRLHQEQLSCLTAAHQEALSSLTNKAEGLEMSLNNLEARRAEEAKELAMSQRETELLQKQLSKTKEDLEAQVTLVENLRTYVGDQVPSEVRSQAWELERQELLETVQRLQEDRDTLRSTSELLQVRVQSLTYILSLQEEEMANKIQPSESLEPELTKKFQSLLTCWREKVFSLMVQLKTQELGHREYTEQLKGQVAELEEKVAAQSHQQVILQRSLQDKAAEVEVERVNAKTLQGELSRALEARRRQQQQMATEEEHLKLVASSVCSSQIWLQNTMAKVEQAVARLPSLSNRLNYAARKVHTIQGLVARKVALAQLRQESCPPPPRPPPVATDVSLELQQLREERNRLDAELQLSAHLIQQEVGRAREQGEAERKQLSEVTQQLEQELQRAQESLASVGLQLEVARQGQQESTEEAASLRRELTQQQEVYGQALQEKVAEVETRLREQLSETERRLNEARREHAKAVVSLRQIQRKAAREKERNQQLRQLQEEARKEEALRLMRRLQELERDKNLMLDTLRQEGLLSRHKQQRLLAVLPSLLEEGKSVESSPKPPGSSAPPVPPASSSAAVVPSSRDPIKRSLSTLLDDLQGLTEAIAKEEDLCQGDNRNSSSSSLLKGRIGEDPGGSGEVGQAATTRYL
ncbi:PREDICTED: coiled-coil alpha-helical rod protein 1 [Chrysochloris asiatica]|uniref:Coiled-coil alpha-helical rod protein 1 n=1 Tax=Chrysochloris asiatica TaxID=185453 RepID=A0A9B0U3V1_CHRAS|nr:PREDICTED: coiled-coil alpha-helical rod protein 1 [Chrysochloris asiatica]